ncbi:AAA family ATPase [Paenibacillus sp. 481]|uniref:AAA family ATPase n=1 Tax=Paenibacillus sp. 481 TaxID=2835869 RepID=UPI001E447E77|nr:AAA family ATPase [Paenibacillus sp. 481]UHA74436.1 AAA family ATPase [Paenibacillus sp. 481]
MQIKFLELKLASFKNHGNLKVNFTDVTRISGTNGAGKSSIGEAIAWVLFGVDSLGSKSDPSPTTYDFEQVEAELLLTVDDKQVLLGRTLPVGKAAKFYINEVPKKAKEFEEIVSQLFDKQLFMSLFTPSFFFTQHWEEQRAQLLRYVLPPANKEVFAQLPAPQAEKLAEQVKKKSLEDLQAQHADNKRKQDKALIAAKSRTKTLIEQLESAPDTNDIDAESLTQKLCEINKKLDDFKEKQGEARAHNAKIEKLKVQLQVTKDGANKIRAEYKQIHSIPVENECTMCGQKLTDDAAAVVIDNKEKQLDEIKSRYQVLSDQYSRMEKELTGLEIVEIDDAQALFQQKSDIESQLKTIESQDRLALAIEEAKQNERDIHESYTESVFILDSIKAFKAKEAELMAEKVGGLFETLTLKLFAENKGDGEQKPFFEVEVNGKPYRKLSTAEKILAGLELISVLSEQSGVAAPVFVDNAESIIKYQAPDGQLIECRVADTPFTVTEV